jgi:hypothetical protein
VRCSGSASLRIRLLEPLARDIVALAAATALLALGSAAVAVLDPAGPLPSEWTRAAVFAVAVLAGILWLLPSPTAPLTSRRIAAAAVPPLLAGLAATGALLVTTSDQQFVPGGVTAAVCAALSSVLAAVWLLLPRAVSQPLVRTAWRAGTAVSSVLTAVASAIAGGDATWIVLLLAGIVFGLLSASEGDPFRSRGPVRLLGWGAAALGASSLWWSLVDNAVVDVEPYTLPVAGLLLAILIAIMVRSEAAAGIGRSALLVGGLGLALLPSAAIAFSTGGARAIVVVAVSVALSMAAPVLPETVRGVSLRLTVVAVAAPVALLVSSARAVDEALGQGQLAVEAWLLAGVVTVLVTSVGWFTRVPSPLWPATAAAIGGIAALAIVESIAMTEGRFVVIRLVGTLCLLGAAHVGLAAVAPSRPVRAIRLAATIGLAAVTAIGAALTDLVPLLEARGAGSVPAVELATVPTALALIVAGALLLVRHPSTNSWRAIGPGLTLAFLPSLLLDLGPTDLWRAVALGVASFAAIIVGVMIRRAAPLLLGAVTFVIHALAQLWPWISDVYGVVPWWLWIGVGGVILIVIAARYEQRVKNLKDAVVYVGSLR